MNKILLIFILTSTILFSNTFKIINEDGNPIQNVQIYNDYYGTISDKEGLFILKNKCLEYEISHIGFQKVIINSCEVNKEIIIKRLAIPSNEITVLGDLGQSKLKNILSNVEIFTRTNILNSNKTSLEDILKSSTNVNYSGVNSRPRYFAKIG